MKPVKKIGVLISGSGTTLQCIIDNIKESVLKAEIAVVISSSESAYGLKRAEQAKIPVFVAAVEGKSPVVYSTEIFQKLKKYQVDLVVMAGFIKKYLPPSSELPTINLHPALLPAFGGKGMYGHHVHRAVKEYGCKVSGCTVHFVTDEYDAGPIIAQETIAISHADTSDQIEKNVQALEKKVFIKVLQKFTEGKVSLENRIVTVL